MAYLSVEAAMRHVLTPRLSGTRSRFFYALGTLAVVWLGVVYADEPLTIVTVAGRTSFTGDGGPAVLSRIGEPEGIACDPAGNVLVGDFQDNLLRFINRSGQPVTIAGQTIQPGNIASIAGSGLAGYNGDNIPATKAELTTPRGIWYDAPRNVFYFADSYNQRIRKVDLATGIISTAAGTGNTLYNGDTDPLTGHPLATEANLWITGALVCDASGNIYLGEGAGVRVRRVDAVTGFISTVAGGNARAATATAGWPVVTMPDTSGFAAGDNVFGPGIPVGATVVSVTPNTSMMISQAPTQSGAITLTTNAWGYGGDGGPATAAMFNLMEGIALDASGNLYVSDAVNQRIRFVNLSNASVTIAGNQVVQPGYIATVIGGGSGPDGGLAVNAHLNGPQALVFDKDGNLFMADGGRIRRVDAKTGIITTIAGGLGGAFRGDGGPSNQATVSVTYGLAVDGSGNLVVPDNGNNRVRVIAPPLDGTGIITTIAGGGGAPPNDGGQATAANLNNPALIAFDVSGNLFFIDGSNNRIRRIEKTTQIITTVVGNGSVTNLFQTNLGDGLAAKNATMNSAGGLTFDASGNLFFGDTSNQRVRKVTASHDPQSGNPLPIDGSETITTVVGTGFPTSSAHPLGDGGPAIQASLNAPRGPAFDLSGNLYFADVNNFRIRKVEVDSVGNFTTITTVVGTGHPTFGTVFPLGDNGPANVATVNGARFVTIDAKGNLYTPDVNNLRVRVVIARVDPNTGNPLPFDGTETIKTVLGDGVLYGAQPPPGSPATLFSIVSPRQIAVSYASGTATLYTVDNWLTTVYKVTATDGVVDGDNNDLMTVLAGTTPGTTVVDGFNGDGIPSTSALLDAPAGCQLDANGNLYIGDYGNNRIRRLNVAAKSVSINTNADGAGGIGARVELNSTRTPSQLSGVTLRAVDATGGVTFDSTGLVPTDAFTGSDLGSDPTDSQAEVYSFGSHPTLLGGAGFRVEAVLSDQKFFSGDAHFSIAWSPPAAITYGTPLSTAQLNATVSAQVPDSTGGYTTVDLTGNTTITYNPPLGTVLNVGGGQAITAHFVPNDPTLGTADWTVLINVTYRICPLYDQTKAVNSGATVPIQLYLGDVNSTDVSSPTVVVHATALTLTGSGTSGVLTAAGNANPNNNFSFDPTLGPSGGYVFNLKTTGLSAGTWQLTFTVSGDPLPHCVSFQIR
jgi:sugar lactone lactonase YvrE